jgi:hypothetical protein
LQHTAVNLNQKARESCSTKRQIDRVSLLMPLAITGIAGCIGGDRTSGFEEEIIGGFPARSARYNAVGALGFRSASRRKRPTTPRPNSAIAHTSTGPGRSSRARPTSRSARVR